MADTRDEAYRIAHMQKALIRKARREARLSAEAEEKATRDREQQKLDEQFMTKALIQAKKAFSIGEVPIGCVIVKDGVIIARGYNRRNTDHSALSHAEVTAIRKACHKLGDWRLQGCTLYVTLEPCPMCAGCCVQSRVDRVVIGAMSPKSGCSGSLLNILQNENFNHRVDVTDGILADSCSAILTDFFAQMRKKR